MLTKWLVILVLNVPWGQAHKGFYSIGIDGHSVILRRRCTPQSPPPSVQWKPRWAIFKSTILPTSSPGCCPIRPLGTTLSSYVKVGDCFKEAAWPSGLCVGLVSGRPGYESRSDPVCGFVMGRPEFISSATFVNSELFASSRLEFLILLPT